MVATVPLALLSELVEELNAGQTNAAASRMFDRLVECSEVINKQTQRRFDEYIKTRSYTARLVGNGGDLLTAYDLRLNYDLKSLTSLTNGDGTTIDTANVILKPDDPPYRILHLNKTVNTFFRWTGDPVNSIKVAGVWGCGGEWLDVTTLNGGINATVTSLATVAALEKGMLILIDTEYLYVNAVSGTGNLTASVQRGVNGSTKAAHLTGAGISRYVMDASVHRAVKRMMAWANAQVKSPLVGTATAPDGTVWPIDASAIPKDLMAVIQSLAEVASLEGV